MSMASEIHSEQDCLESSVYREAQREQMQTQCLASLKSLIPHYLLEEQDAQGRYSGNVSPLSALAMPKVNRCDLNELHNSVKRARLASKRWAHTEVAVRSRMLLRMHDLLLSQRDEFLDLIQFETGKSRQHAFEELADFAQNSRYYALSLPKMLRYHARRGLIPGVVKAKVGYQPRGVVGIISPWNYPLSLSACDALAAIAAGNAVILKPDSATPLTALAVRELMIKAGLDKDLFIVLPGSGRELAPELVAGCDYVMFTGSSQTGMKISKLCGEQGVPCSLELGGKNSLIVLPGANVDKAVNIAIHACFSSGGQLCVSMERIEIPDSLYQEFATKFVSRINEMNIGPSLDWDSDMGVMISVDHVNKLLSQIHDATSKGAQILCGAKVLNHLGPTCMTPTVLENVNSSMKIYAQESFGPIVSLFSYSSYEQMVDRVNDTPYGLHASIVGPVARAQAIAKELRTGSVSVNDDYLATWGSVHVPIGGRGISGRGRRHGREGLYKYMHMQSIVCLPQFVSLRKPSQISALNYSLAFSFLLRVLRYLRIR